MCMRVQQLKVILCLRRLREEIKPHPVKLKIMAASSSNPEPEIKQEHTSQETGSRWLKGRRGLITTREEVHDRCKGLTTLAGKYEAKSIKSPHRNIEMITTMEEEIKQSSADLSKIYHRKCGDSPVRKQATTNCGGAGGGTRVAGW